MKSFLIFNFLFDGYVRSQSQPAAVTIAFGPDNII